VQDLRRSATDAHHPDDRSGREHLARADVGPEHSWSGEGGAELFLSRDVVLHATVFHRADSNVIDWLRPDTTARWQTYNVRDVDTTGFELSVTRPLARGGLLTAGYTGLDVSAPAVTQLSKYALDYVPRSFTTAVVLPRFGPVRVARGLNIAAFAGCLLVTLHKANGGARR